MNYLRAFPTPDEVRPPEIITPDPDGGSAYTKRFLYNKLDNFDLDTYLYEPDEQIDEVPLIVIAGFAATRVVYERLAEEIAMSGRKVSLHLPPRKHARWASYSRKHLFDALRLQAQATRANMRSVRAYSGEEQFDILGHSMGNVIGVKAAHELIGRRETAMVRSLISDAGAGLNGPGSGTKHVRRLPHVVTHELLTGIPRMVEISPPTMKKEATLHVVSSIGRLAREGYQVMMKADVRDKVADVRDASILYGGLLPEYDQFFPPDEVLEHSAELLDWYRIIPEAYHVDANTDPIEHALEVDAALAALNSLRSNTRLKTN